MSAAVIDMNRIQVAADLALAEGRPVVIDDYLVVPDVIMVEAEANGADASRTWRLERDDGRTVTLYRVPAELAAEVTR